MQCLSCGSTVSPDHARFCVACGMPVRQPCPHPGCGDFEGDEFVPTFVSLGTKVQAANQCHSAAGKNSCHHFYLHCPHCRRLYTLADTACVTPHCSHPPLQEAYELWPGPRGGHDHDRAAILRNPWHLDHGRVIPGQIDTESPVLGLAFRYSRLLWVTETQLCVAAFNRWFLQRQETNLDTVRSADVPLRDQVLGASNTHNDENALLVAHGCVYILAVHGALRVKLGDVGRGAVEPDRLDGRFARQVTTDTHWIGLEERDDVIRVRPFAAYDESGGYGADFDLVPEIPLPQLGPGLRDAVAVGERLFLATESGLWVWTGRGAESAFGPELEGASILSLAAHAGAVIVLGRGGVSGEGIWFRRLFLDGRPVAQAVPVPAQTIYPQPALLGERAYVWDNSPGKHQLLGFNLDQPMGRVESLPYMGGANAVCAIGARTVNHGWLVYALDEGVHSTLHAVGTNPYLGDSRPLGIGMSGYGRISLAIADGFLVVAGSGPGLRVMNLFPKQENVI